jgi:hypothetical protein
MSTTVVAGALANKPGNGGEAWVRLSWLLGLRRLGYTAWLVEQIDPAHYLDSSGAPCAAEDSSNLAWFDAVIARFGLEETAALIHPDGTVVRGPEFAALADVVTQADLLMNISGNLGNRALLGAAKRRLYLDLDPGYTQAWHRDGLLTPGLAAHDVLLSVGLQLGTPGARVNVAGLSWRPTPPPVVLDEWPCVPPPKKSIGFTTVASWRGGYGRLSVNGQLYGQKAHEFRRFADLPADSGADLLAAISADPADAGDLERLRAGGWTLVDPARTTQDPDRFRSFVQSSAGEFSPAQGVYVETACGWLSDRTTRYLASGRPAIVQDTSLGPAFPTGEGLLTFSTPDEARACLATASDDYERHATAARALAEEHLDSDRVIGRLLEEVLP